MVELTKKSYKSYESLSRYEQVPYYYYKKLNKYIYGTSKYLNNETPFVSYKVKRNDTWDSIALYYYNNPTYYWILLSYNRVQDPFQEPTEGQIIKVPTFSTIYFS